MGSRLIVAVAAAAALSSGLSVTLTEAFGANAATGTAASTPTQLAQQTNTLLSAIDHKLTDIDDNLAGIRARGRVVSAQLTSVQQKQVTENQLSAKTYDFLFAKPTWLNRGVSRYGYMGRMTQMLSAMCTLQAVQAQNFDYCTDNVSGVQPTP